MGAGAGQNPNYGAAFGTLPEPTKSNGRFGVQFVVEDGTALTDEWARVYNFVVQSHAFSFKFLCVCVCVCGTISLSFRPPYYYTFRRFRPPDVPANL